MESKNPTIRVSIPSLKPTSISRPHHFLLSLIIITIINTTAAATTSQFYESYSKHCDQILPVASIPTTGFFSHHHTLHSFRLDTGFFSTSNPDVNATNTNTFSYIRFETSTVSKTANNDVLHLKSVLNLEDWNSTSWVFSHGKKRLVHLIYGGQPRIRLYSEKISFHLEGFWSSSSGNICMVGSGSSISQEGTTVIHNVVFKLNYPNATTIVTSLVSGVIESLDSSNNSLSYFDPIRVLGISDKNYEYTLIEKEGSSEKFGDDKDNRSTGLAPTQDICTDINFLRHTHTLELDYSNDECENRDNCNRLGKGFDVLPKYMFFGDIRCSEKGRMRFLIWFSESSYISFGLPFHTQTILVAEGLWNVNRSILRIVACRISHSTLLANASVEDCSYRLSLRFSPSLSLRNMSVIEGQIWNNESEDGKDHFARIGFSSPKVNMMPYANSLAYEYTEFDSVKNICAKKAINRHTGSTYTYPGENSADLSFSMTVKSGDGREERGWISPLYVNSVGYTPCYDNSNSENHSVPVNMTYYVSYGPRFDFYELPGKEVGIFAEGVYDRQTGFLCMKGCRHLDSHQRNLTKHGSLDCEILVNVQYRPLNSKVQDMIKGVIESMRANSDPLYFDPLEVSSLHSIYASEMQRPLYRRKRKARVESMEI